MFFGIFGGSEARRYPGHFPWIPAAFWTIVVLLIAGLVIAGIALATDWFSGSAQVEPRQAEQVDTAPAGDVPAVVENPPAQDTQPSEPAAGAVAPAAWPLVHVEWSEPRLLAQYPLNLVHTDSGNTGKEDERFTTAIALLPELEELSTERGVGIWVTITRDREHPEVVLVGISVVDARQAFRAMEQGETPTKGTTLLWARLFVSVDAEASWYEISLLESKDNIPALAVSETDGVIHVSVRENTVQEIWREATLPIKALP